MNLEQIDTSITAGKAEVMRRAAEGRRVAAFLPTQPTAQWGEVDDPVWDWNRTQYAIIAEPVGPDVVFVTVCEGDPIDVYKSETTAACSHSWQVVRYVRAD